MSDFLVFHAPRLDPVTVYFKDMEPGRGSVVVECYGCAWSCFWGAMGNGKTLREFIRTADAEYVANCLIRGRRQFISSKRSEAKEMEYLTRVCGAVIEGLRSLHNFHSEAA